MELLLPERGGVGKDRVEEGDSRIKVSPVGFGNAPYFYVGKWILVLQVTLQRVSLQGWEEFLTNLQYIRACKVASTIASM